jgi:predicted nucleic acid-binding protein
MRLVCNASPLIFLAKLDLIQLLPRLTEELIIPVGVYDEIKGQNDASSEWIEKFKNEYIIEIGSVPKLIESWDLGQGETEVIAHAYSHQNFKVALDDRAARNCAASIGVKVIGTIGLIILAKKKGYIEKPVAILKKLKKTGFRISDELFEHAIHLAGK